MLSGHSHDVWLVDWIRMREERLVFGEVAELYDLHRPAYPDELIDELVALARLDGSRPILEVGAGTGKATMMFAARGIPVVAVEPSLEMAAVARRNCSAHGDVVIEQSDFEHWESKGRRFPLLYSAQAWHWVRAEEGYAKAREALLPRGVLAVFWNRAAWAGVDIREAILQVYDELAPELDTDSPMHPANLDPDVDAEWEREIAAIDGLSGSGIRYYEWNQNYSAAEYVGLLATLSYIRLMCDARRVALLTAVADVIDAHGQPLTLPMRTRLCLARRN
jgi:SAM-dependent methyltransferase